MAEETTITQEKETKSESLTLSQKTQDIIESIESMSVLELSGLVKALEDKFGVVAAAPVAVAGSAASAPGASEEAGEATVNVILASCGDKKIQVLKAVREITGLPLKEAKDLVDNLPKPVKEGLSKEEAQDIKKKLEEQGAKVELK